MASNASLLRTLSVEFNYVLNHQNRYQFLSLKHHVNQRKRSSLKASKIPLTVSHAQRALQTAMVPVATVQANLLTNRAILRSEEHTSELQSRPHLVCRLLLEKKKKKKKKQNKENNKKRIQEQ